MPKFVSKPRVVGGISPTDPLDLATKGYIDGRTARTIYGTVETAVATAAKTVTISDYTLASGDILILKFTLGNTANTVTLNVNGSGAANIRIGNTNVTNVNFTLAADSTVALIYDGTNFQTTGSYRTTDSDTTYTELTTAEIDAGTASTLRTITGRRSEYIVEKAAPLTTKGDLLGFNTARARLPVGLDGEILIADSTQTLGVKWASGPAGPTGPTGPSYYSEVNSQAGTSYTIQLSDAADLIRTTSDSAVTVQIPLASTTDFPIGSSVEILQVGAGQVTVTGVSGVTIRTPALAKTRTQYSLISAIHVTTDEWVVVGDLAVV